MDVDALVAPRVREMQSYAPIVPFDVLSKRLDMAVDRIVKLDANENPYGSSPRALEAIAQSRLMHIYPDPDQTALREAVASEVGVGMEHILCGAGADEVIDTLARTFIEPGDAILDLPPTFGMYKWEADILGARHVAVRRRSDFSIDVDAVERAVRETAASGSTPKLLFVSNPNNPDGSVTVDSSVGGLDLDRIGRLALDARVPLSELRRADSAGLEELFFSLTSSNQEVAA